MPKLVGQSQFFINDLAWEPVHLLYADIRMKMQSSHTKILHIMRQTQNPSRAQPPTILLVAILQLLSRTETIDIHVPVEAEFKVHFFRLLAHTNMNVREFAALCMARFHQFYEIPDFLERIVPLMCSSESDVNLRHGLLCAAEQMLSKYKSDSRCMPLFADKWESIEKRMQDALNRHWNEASWSRVMAGRYYLLVQLYRVFQAIGCEATDGLMRKIAVGEPKVSLCLKESEYFGLSAWAKLTGTHAVESALVSISCPEMNLRRQSNEL